VTATERWRRIEEICQSALDLADVDRPEFLAEVCGSDEPLRREVEKLLSRAQDAEAFLTQPLAAIAAHVLPSDGEILSGSRLGVLEIGALLGRGGMGEVYRARDTRLGRDVALKVIPDAFARDPERLARFQREAKVLASLNHPNIAAIYGLEESGNIRGLVLELVEGPTLAERLARGAIPLAETLGIARQVAEGMEAAHERGVVHRDLKPANIKLRPDGMVKVLDFGLARALDDAPGDADIGESRTSADQSLNTRVGALLGTPEYMSPEQRKGLTADKRTDIWAFGAMVYEMLTGRRLSTTTAAAAASANAPADGIDWTALPSGTPTSVTWLIGRCLALDPRQRLRDIGEARILLENPALLPVVDPSAAHLSRGRYLWPAAAAAGIALAIVGGLWARYPTRSTPPTVTRFAIPLPTLPPGANVGGGPRIALALSPNGSQLVFAANNGLYLRPLATTELQRIRGSDAHQLATAPVFSPDGRFVAFWALSDYTLKRMPVTGGSAETICAAVNPFGIDWTAEHILFGQDGKGILRVDPSGGEPTPIVTVADGEQADSPQLLPGGTHVLFTLAKGTARDRWDQAQVVAQSLASSERKILLTGSHARYVATGHLIYAISGTLFARPFDLRRLEVTGDAVPVIVGIGRSTGGTTGVAQFSVSDSGSLAYLAGPLSVMDGAADQLSLIDRRGLVEPLKVPAGMYVSPRASPDGSRVVFGTDTGKEAIVWTYELSGGIAMQQLTTIGNSRFPIWTSDSKRIVFQSDREGDHGLFWQPADGTGTAERLTRPAPGEAHIPDSWSPTSNTLMFSVATGSVATGRRYSLATLSLPGKTVAAYGGVQSADPPGAVFSPDGRWVAYGSSVETGKTTVYVQPFPATGAPFPLPARGFDTPHAPVWSPSGKEIFYNLRPGGFEAVSVTTQPTFMFGVPSAIPSPFRGIPPYGRRSYDITSDGRFLGSVAVPSQGSDTGPASEVQVVLNWFRELRERVPAGR
jgi:serine/threonine-protein kinase